MFARKKKATNCLAGDRVVRSKWTGSLDRVIPNFELYGLSERSRCLDRVMVRRSDGSLEDILKQVIAEAAKGNIDPEQLARFIAELAPRCVNSKRYPEFFRLWEKRGIHLTPVHFYQPIPDTRRLPESLWIKQSDLAGIEMNDAAQLDLLRNSFPPNSASNTMNFQRQQQTTRWSSISITAALAEPMP